MKAMMTAVAALTAGIAMADVTSANIVGYQNAGFKNAQYNICAASMLPVGMQKANMKLKDLVPNENFIQSSIMFLTPGGATPRVDFKSKKVPQKYVWWTEDDEPEDGAGWYLYDDDDAEINQGELPIPFGTGFLVYRNGAETEANLVYAGEVQQEPITLNFPNTQYNILGNCSPVDLSLADITPNEKFVQSSIMFLTPGGATPRVDFKSKKVPQKYVWWTEDDEPEDGAGWYLYDDDDAEINQGALPIKAGEGFLVYRNGAESEAELQIPSPISAK